MRKLFLATLFLWFAFSSPAFALIFGGTDKPMADRGLPNGSLPLANLKTRIAWWEGGGRYHFEYAGRTADLQKAIDLFRNIAPSMVFTHPRHDYMLDHEQVHQLARAATGTNDIASTRIAMPSSLPAMFGNTFPTARAAPVVVGIVFSAAALDLRQSE